MITPDYIFEQIAKCQNNHSEFDYEAHKKIEKHNKKFPYGGLKGTFIFDEFPLPDWAEECDPSLSGKLNGITVKNWSTKKPMPFHK